MNSSGRSLLAFATKQPPMSSMDHSDGKSLVLIIDDPDAPDPKAPKVLWVHWVVYNMPADTKSLPENAGKAPLHVTWGQ
jgi:phosphatidylethanolamine-binding protein (PEBP) family uncharacterized protein